MKKRKYTQWVWIVVLVIAFLFSIYFYCCKDYYITTGEKQETISLAQSGYIVQELNDEGVYEELKICFMPIISDFDIESSVQLEITDTNSKLKNSYKLENYRTNEWNWIEITSPKLKKMDNPRVKITGNGLENGNDVLFILYSGCSTQGVFERNVQIGNAVEDDASLNISVYRTKPIQLKALVISFIIIMLVVALFAVCIKFFRDDYCTQIMIILCTIALIRMRLWNCTLSAWSYVKYLVSYKYGIYTQALIGSIINGLFDQVGVIHIKIIASIFVLLAIIAFYKILKLSDDTDYKILSLVLIVSPLFITRYFDATTYAMFDIFIFALFCIIVYLISQERIIWMVIPLTIIGTLSYQQFVFCAIPLILLLLLYKAHVNRNKKFLLLFNGTLIVNFIVALTTQIVGTAQTATAVTVAEKIQEHTMLEVPIDVLKTTYFSSINEVIKSSKETIYSCKEPAIIIISLIILVPFFSYVIRIWCNMMNLAESKKVKFIYVFMLASILVPVMTFIIQCDWSRYLGSYIINFVVIILILYSDEKSKVQVAIKNVHTDNAKRYGEKWYIVLLCYLVFLGAINGCKTAEFVNDIPEAFGNLFSYFLQS